MNKIEDIFQRRYIQLILLIIISIVAHFPYLWESNLTGSGDTFYQDFTLRVLVSKFWSKGEFPIWNPYNFTGSPLAAVIHIGTFYPPNFLYCIFSPILAYKMILIFSMWWLGAGFLYWALNKNYSTLISILIAITAMLIPMHEFIHLQVRDTLIWFPWMLWSADCLLKKYFKSFKWILINSFIWTCSFLAGHPQYFLYLIITLFAYIISQKAWRIQWLWSSLISLLLTLPQILLTLPLYLNSFRANEKICQSFFFQPNTKQIADTLLCFTIPFHNISSQFNRIESIIIIYSSILLFSACIATLFVKDKFYDSYKIFFLWNLLISVSFSFTKIPCIIPLLKSFRLHHRFIQTIFLYAILISSCAFFNFVKKNPSAIIMYIKIIIILMVLSAALSFWIGNYKEIPLKIILSPEYAFAIFLFVVLIILKKHKYLNLKNITLLIFSLIIINSFIGYNKLLKDWFAFNLFDISFKSSHYYLKNYSINKIFTSDTSWLWEKKLSPEERFLNAIFSDHNLYLHAHELFAASIDMNIVSYLLKFPKIWPLFGVSHYIETTEYLNFYERRKIEFINKIFDLNSIKFNHNKLIIKAGCLNLEKQGWLLLKDKNGNNYYLGKIKNKTFQLHSSLNSQNKIILICPNNINEMPYLIIHKKDNLWGLVDVKLNKQKDFELPAQLYERKKVQAFLTKDNSILFFTIKEDFKGEVILISLLGNKIIKSYEAGVNLMDIIPFIIYKKDSNPSLWLNAIYDEAYFYNLLDSLKKNKKYSFFSDLHPIIKIKLYLTLTNHHYLEYNKDWQRIRIIPILNHIIYEYKRKPYPDAWAINTTRKARPEKFLKMLQEMPIQIWKTIGIVNTSSRIYKLPKDKSAKVEIKESKPTSLLIRTHTKFHQVIVIRIHPDYCWEAKLDNKQASLFPINYAMQGIVVPPGDHNVFLHCAFFNSIKNTIKALITNP